MPLMSSAPPFPPPPPPPPTGTDLPPSSAVSTPPAPPLKPETSTKGEELPPLPPVKFDWIGALLSYLIPGLGQVYQGRIGKGLLFFFGLYTLFFYGMWMGKWQNVWLPDVTEYPPLEMPIFGKMSGVPSSLYYRPQFMGQFWIGVASWPA